MVFKEYSPDQIDYLKDAWTRLETGAEMTVFQSYKWYCWINNVYDKEKTKNLFRKWTYIVAEEDGNPVMIAPVQIVRVGCSIKGVGLARGGISSGVTATLTI